MGNGQDGGMATVSLMRRGDVDNYPGARGYLDERAAGWRR